MKIGSIEIKDDSSKVSIGVTGSLAPDTYFYVSGSEADRTVLAGAAVVSGSLNVKGGISGSLTHLDDGSSYLVAGVGITLASQSNGSILITSSPPASDFWQSSVADAIFTTGSVEISGSLFVSASITGSNLVLDDPASRILAPNGALVISSSAGTFITGSLTVSGTRSNLGTEQSSILFKGDLFVSGGIGSNDYLQLKPVGSLIIPTNTTSSYVYVSGSTNDLYFTQYNGPYTNTTRLRWLESTLSTGLLHGGVLSTQNGTTTFSITSGSGIIVAYNASTTTDPYPTVKFVEWPAYVSQSLTYSGSDQISYIGINNTAGIIQRNVPFDNIDYENTIYVGRVLHQSGSVTNGTITSPSVAYAQPGSHDTFIRAFGPLKLSGHFLAASGSTLSLTKTGGDSYVEGRNYTSNPSSPDLVLSTTDSSVTVSKIFREHVSGSTPVLDTGVGNAGYAAIDPTLYNNGGTLASVPAGQYSTQRVFWFPNSANRAFIVYYGSTLYNSLDVAQAAIPAESFTEGTNTQGAAIFVGYIIVKGNASDLSNTSEARIIQGPLFRSAGSAAGGSAGGLTPAAGLDTYVQFNDGGSTFGGDAGFTYNKNTDTLSVGNVIVASGATVSGSLVVGGIAALDGNIILGNAASDQVYASGSLTASNGLALTGSSTFAAGSTFTFSGSAVFESGLSGSLTHLADGSSYLVAGANITITSQSNGQVQIDATDPTPIYWSSIANDAIYTTGSVEISGSVYLGDSALDSVQVTGSLDVANGAVFRSGLSGSLTQLPDGTSYLIAGPGILITSASGGAITIESPTTPDAYWQSSTQDVIFTTGSVQLTGTLYVGLAAYLSGSLWQGDSVLASGLYTHAEGQATTASANYSHAEGRETRADGQHSHAEGYQTLTLQPYAHSEGYLTTGSGFGSHAEGGEGEALGTYSHAEGYKTIAEGSYSHAEGYQAYASGTQSHAEGFFSLSLGVSSHAEGFFTTASANDSHSEGFRTISLGYASHAEGGETISYGDKSHAEGQLTIAVGPLSHAEGYQTTASVNTSHAEGAFTNSSGTFSHAEGYYSTTFGVGSHAEGYITTASGDYSHTEGNGTYTSASFAHAEGGNTTALGESSHAEGGSTIAYGFASHTEGFFTTTSPAALGSHAEGAFTVASGSVSHAEGAYTLAEADASHAEGYLTTGSGLGSHSEGFSTVASGTFSHAGGMGTIASGSGQTVVGSYNLRGNSASLFVIGDGTADDNANRADILRVNPGPTSGLGRVEVTGTISANQGISGSLQALVDGSPYLISGPGISITSQSIGTVTVSAIAADQYWFSTGSGEVYTTGSAKILGDLTVVGTIFGGSPVKLSGGAVVTGSLEVTGFITGALYAPSGLSGSLTKLTDGTSYLIAGNNVQIASASNGAVTITSLGTSMVGGNGSNNNVITADGSGGLVAEGNMSFDGSTLFVFGSEEVQGNLTVGGSMASLSTTNLDIRDGVVGIGFSSGSVPVTAGDRGWIGGLATLDNVLFKWDHTAAEFAMARTTASSTASLPVPISSYSNLHVANIQASIVTASLGFSGSLTRLADGSSYLSAGNNISIASASNGSITISAPNLALASAPYVTIGNDANLTNERALTAGTGITLADGGANSTVTLGINNAVVATISGSTFTGAVKFNEGLSGSLTHLADGTSYLIAGSGMIVASASNGAITLSTTGSAPLDAAYVTIGNTSGLTSERALAAGTGLTLADGGANSSVTLGIDNSVVATVSGSTFTGAVKFNGGLSGSLTHLVDGTSYLIAGSGIQITTGAAGAVTVANTGQYPPGGSQGQVQYYDGGNFGGSPLFTFNSSTGAVTASTYVAPSAVITTVTSSKAYTGHLEADNYLRLNPYSSNLVPIGTTTSSYMFSSGANGNMYFGNYHTEDSTTQLTSLDWIRGGSLRTGLLFGGKLTTAVGSTTFSITSGSGIIVDYNTDDNREPYPIITQVRWGNFISQSLTFVTASQLSYIGIDKNANIVQQTSPFDPSDRASILQLGRVSHPALTTAQLANMFPDVAYGTQEWHEDFTRAFGPLKISGHKLTVSGSSLRVNKAAGESYIAGGNYFYNTDRPNYILDTEDTEKTDLIYIRLWVSGSALQIDANPPSGFTALDPNNYNLDGTRTPVPSGSFSVLRLYWIPRNSRDVINGYYGSEVYDTLGEAVAGITTENFVESENTKTSNIFLGYVAVQSGSTDLSDPTKAKIIQGGLSRNVAGGGGAAGTGAGSTAAGLATYVQFNLDGTNFGGDPDFTFNSTTNVLTVGNAMVGGTGELKGAGTTFDLLDTTVQTINFGGAATTIDVGSTAGTNTLFGATKMPQGLSGSLTQLTDGSSYLIASGNITITSASNGAVTVGTTALSAGDHRTVRQLIHLAEEGGPFEGFTLGSYRETLPSGNAFPTSIIWWESSSKLKKIVEETITYNSQKLVITDQWRVYDTDGTTVLATATDSVTYAGVFETNRTRTIT